MYNKIVCILLLFLGNIILPMEKDHSEKMLDMKETEQKLWNHFQGNIFNLKTIFDDIPFLIEVAANENNTNNNIALMLLIDYAESTKIVFDFFSYGVQHTIFFNNVPWQKMNLDFFRKNKPEGPADYYYWGMFYANSIVSRLNQHKDMIDDLKELTFNHISQSAEAEFPKGMYWLGHLYLHGLGTEIDPKKAFSWKNKAAQAQYIPALFDVGNMYLHGIGVQQNVHKGIKLINKAATQKEYSTANHYLGILYEAGNISGYNDPEKACDYYKKATNMGCLDAQTNLGLIYIKKNIDIIPGLYYLHEAAQKGSPRAQYILGGIFYRGDIIKRDATRGLQLIKNAAAQNHPLAHYRLGKLFITGFPKKNIRKGLKHLKKANLPVADYALAMLYIEGKKQEIPQNLELGVSLLKKAAKAQLPRAQFSLGMMYLNGNKDIKKNENKGLVLISKAAHQNYKPAQEYLQKIL